MMDTYTLTSPFLELEFEGAIPFWLVIAWTLFWGAVVLGIIYLYAFLLPGYVGFETATLIGIGAIALEVVTHD